jgi:hypothetical protein
VALLAIKSFIGFWVKGFKVLILPNSCRNHFTDYSFFHSPLTII